MVVLWQEKRLKEKRVELMKQAIIQNLLKEREFFIELKEALKVEEQGNGVQEKHRC